ncbi:hypothetical protein [Kozakia baliensis]|uniref:hypothetical protein n=1 Tax=Kozakia baliensis TaxID=153496 RepID=UPI00069036B5|nr:hypothetical protein [Kozakia baliensis]
MTNNKNLRYLKALVIAGSLFSLTACQELPPFNFAVKDVPISQQVVQADLRSIMVNVAHPDEKTGHLDPSTDKALPAIKESLNDALNRATIFQDDAAKHVNLQATVLKLDPPAIGITMVTDMDCRYVITDRSTGAPIFNEVITSQGKVPMGFSWIGVIRAKESINRAVQNNIAGFLDKLEHDPMTIARTPMSSAPVVSSSPDKTATTEAN